MSRTRDIIQEIAEVRHRRQFDSAMAELPLRLFALETAFKNHDKADSELVRYFPVALIACVEGYFRMAIKDLIDAGEPFLTNAEKPASSLKLDFTVLRAVHGKTITVGELVAHGIQLSRLDHLEAALSNLLGTGFLQALRTTTDRWEQEVKGTPATPILVKPDQVFADVARTFELRHIICHEIASAYKIEAAEVACCFESCVAFLRAADELISETIHPGAPLSQTDMNIAAGESLREKEKLMEGALAAIKAKLEIQEVSALDESQANWQKFRDSWVNFAVGDRENSGTIWPLLHASESERVVKRRLQEIQGFKRLGDDG